MEGEARPPELPPRPPHLLALAPRPPPHAPPTYTAAPRGPEAAPRPWYAGLTQKYTVLSLVCGGLSVVLGGLFLAIYLTVRIVAILPLGHGRWIWQLTNICV